VDHLCFGSEYGSVERLDHIAEILLNEPDSYKIHLKECLNKGLSYPSSRKSALERYLLETGASTESVDEIMCSSNNILGVEYLKAIKKLGTKIKPSTVKRINNTYNSQQISGNISSATAVRKNILSSPGKLDFDTIKRVIPSQSLNLIEEEFNMGRGPVFDYMYESILLGLMRKMQPNDFSTLPYVSEGLENRLKSASDISGSIDEFIDNVCTKRYTRTRIQRILLSLLTGMTSNEFDNFNKYGGPQYIRVLGFNNKGRELLSKIKKSAVLPIIVKTANFKYSCNPLLKRMLQIEAAATDIYVLGYGNTNFRKAGQEYTQNLIRL
jgi:predicted nucleotidyltransferase